MTTTSLDSLGSNMTNSLSALRQNASLPDVVQEFEAMLVSELWQVMRESVESSGLFEGESGLKIYSEMIDQEVARALVRQGGLGLSRHIEDQLESKVNPLAPPVPVPVPLPTGVRPLEVFSSFGWRQDPITGQLGYHQGVKLAPGQDRVVGRVRARQTPLSEMKVEGAQKTPRNETIG
ncbi:MAG: rod-binding protein [Acidobacteriota bacterium]